jgi:hypothetical protein
VGDKKIHWIKVLDREYGSSLEEKKNSGSIWWMDLNSIKKIQGRGGVGWFENHLRRKVGDGKDTFLERPLGGRRHVYYKKICTLRHFYCDTLNITVAM